MKYFAAYTKNQEIKLKSSAGGVFWELASQTLSSGGVVFGAAWNQNWGVDIIGVSDFDNLSQLMTSKYVLADVKNSYSECLGYLLEGKRVLYSALPCQIHGLKRYLRRDFDNLLCVDVCCHGTMPKSIWKDYLKSLGNVEKITQINMRDKTYGWKNYQFVVKWEDGSEIRQHHNDNLYIKDYLSDKYLRTPCYNCRYKNDFSVADLSIGDFWGVDPAMFDDCDSGISLVVTRSIKGERIFSSLNNITSKEVTPSQAQKHNAGMTNIVNAIPEKISKSYSTPTVGIITLPLWKNIGGILQNYALQQALKKIGVLSQTIRIKRDGWQNIPFTQKYINSREFNSLQNIKQTDFNGLVIGSDQIWRKDWTNPDYAFASFAKNWDIPIVSYAASCGEDRFNHRSITVQSLILPMLYRMNAISIREEAFKNTINKMLHQEKATVVCDPTMLLAKEDYLSLCEEAPQLHQNVGVYLLDRYSDKFCLAVQLLFLLLEHQELKFHRL